MESTLKQRTNFNMVKRFAMSNSALRRQHTNSVETTRDYMKARAKERNTITINTKNTRPVFVERENPDTPPTITDHVRELARFIRTSNSLVAHFRSPALEMSILASYNDAPVYTKRLGKCPRLTADTPRPLWVCSSAPVKGKERGKIYTEYGNIQPEDKPAFRHDSLFLFDTLSEDYSA